MPPRYFMVTPQEAARQNRLATNGGAQRTSPPKPVQKRSTPITGVGDARNELGGGQGNFKEFGDGQYAYGRLPGLPPNVPASGNRPGTLNHLWSGGDTHASLAMGNGKGGIVNTSIFQFWCTEVSFGYGSSGTTAQSKYYAAYYSRSFNRLPISVKGRVPTEAYKENMQTLVRASQVNMAGGSPRVRLAIPAANITVWGFIPSFAGGQEAGFAPAPEISFDFQITRDTSTDKAGRVAQQVIAYFLDPQDKYWKRESAVFAADIYDALASETAAANARERERLKKVNKKNKITEADRDLLTRRNNFGGGGDFGNFGGGGDFFGPGESEGNFGGGGDF